jgi:hypothetical protein
MVDYELRQGPSSIKSLRDFMKGGVAALKPAKVLFGRALQEPEHRFHRFSIIR